MSTYPPRHYYTVQHQGQTLHFCSAHCLIPWAEASIPVDTARTALLDSAGVSR